MLMWSKVCCFEQFGVVKGNLNFFSFAEIFFHFSEAEGDIELRPGDDVEFTIQTRNVSQNRNIGAPDDVMRFFSLSSIFSYHQNKVKKSRAILHVYHQVRLFSKTLVRLFIRVKF